MKNQKFSTRVILLDKILNRFMSTTIIDQTIIMIFLIWIIYISGIFIFTNILCIKPFIGSIIAGTVIAMYQIKRFHRSDVIDFYMSSNINTVMPFIVLNIIIFISNILFVLYFSYNGFNATLIMAGAVNIPLLTNLSFFD